MKKYIIKVSGISLGIVLVIAMAIFNFSSKPEVVVAGVPIGSSYQFKVASTSSASATVPYIIKGGRGVLGSIIIGTTGGQAIRVYDSTGVATSSATSTLITTLKANIAEQELTFDVDVQRGIVLDVPAGFTGVYTVTYRNY